MGEFTPNQVARQEYRDCVRLFTQPSPGNVWHYAGCTHHMRQMVEQEREHGYGEPFYVFQASLGTFCQQCYHFDNQTDKRPPCFNQIAREVWE